MKRKETNYEKYLKRPMDFIGACTAIALMGIPMIVIAVGVKKNLGSPVLYSDTRIGKNETPFRMYKFRSMTNEVDSDGNLLPDAKRLTRFGDFLRSTSLDELPEFFSIIKGDMAFIGPRPLPVEYLPYISEQESVRHTCRGGMSGLAQINGRTSITWDQKFRYDMEYIEKMSFKQDFKIFYSTIKKVFTRENVGIPEIGANLSLYETRSVQRPEFLKN